MGKRGDIVCMGILQLVGLALKKDGGNPDAKSWVLTCFRHRYSGICDDVQMVLTF